MPTDATPSETAAPVSPTEASPAARVGAVLFRNRSWLPVPFVVVPLLALGAAMRLGGVTAAGTVTRRRSRDVQRLVTYGIFSWVRNPLYIGNFLIWIGFGVVSGVY